VLRRDRPSFPLLRLLPSAGSPSAWISVIASITSVCSMPPVTLSARLRCEEAGGAGAEAWLGQVFGRGGAVPVPLFFHGAPLA